MKTNVAVVFMVLAIAALPVLAQPVATASLSATGLSITSQVAYEGAVLRISGPNGYSGTRTFESGEAVQVDLETFGRASADGRVQPDGTLGAEEVGMPEGRYSYEVVFWSDGSKVGAQTGVFFVEGGVATQGSSTAGLRETPTMTGGTSGDDGSDPTELTNVDDVLQINDTAGDDSVHIWWENDNASNWWLIDEDGDMHFREFPGSGNFDRMTIEQGGDVGLGTSTPVLELHMVDGDTPSLRLEQDGSSGFTPQTWDVAGNETNFFIRDATGGSMLPFRIISGAPSNAIYINAAGWVGSRTTSPDAPLDVDYGTAGVGTGNAIIRLARNGDLAFQLNDTTNVSDFWNFAVANNEGEFRISKSGTGTQELILDTGGNLTIAGSLTTAAGDVPDYVFEPDYPLLPLDRLASFIAQEKHLPDVPSAKEMAGRINMSELQLQMLAKIEELTLYILAQERTMNAQEESILMLRSRLDALEMKEFQ